MTGSQRQQSEPPRKPADEWTPKMVMDWVASPYEELAHRATEAALYFLERHPVRSRRDVARLLEMAVGADIQARHIRNGSNSAFLVDVGVTERPR